MSEKLTKEEWRKWFTYIQFTKESKEVKMKKFFMFFVMLLLIVPLVALAQDVEIDIQSYLNAASVIFMTGIGGLSVLGIVQVIKTFFKMQGIAVRVLSVFVSAAAVLVYEFGLGFLWWRALILTVLVTLAANGIYLFPKKET